MQPAQRVFEIAAGIFARRSASPREALRIRTRRAAARPYRCEILPPNDEPPHIGFVDTYETNGLRLGIDAARSRFAIELKRPR